MDIPTVPFEEWEALHHSEISEHFRDYLRDAIDDTGFELTEIEDYWTWAREEYACLRDSVTH